MWRDSQLELLQKIFQKFPYIKRFEVVDTRGIYLPEYYNFGLIYIIVWRRMALKRML